VADLLLRVDENDTVIGYEEKERCHLAPTVLHRAFSIFILNSEGKMLIHKRSSLKQTWPGFWTNACCSHPRKGEVLEEALIRRLREELGFEIRSAHLFTFRYKADYDERYGENEIDHVFLGVYDGEVNPDPDEIEEWRFIDLKILRDDVLMNGGKYTPWFKIALPMVLEYIAALDKER
jgi:isopentenyl-diphosphate Delta-isomerase